MQPHLYLLALPSPQLSVYIEDGEFIPFPMRHALYGYLHPFLEQARLRQQFRLKGGSVRLFMRSHTFSRCCSLLVLLLLVGTITLSMSMQHHATQAAGTYLAENSPPYTVKVNMQAEHSAGGTAYVGSEDNIVYALNASNGLIRWGGQTGFIVDSSPRVVDGIVYVGSDDHKVYALNASSGVLVWSFITGNIVQSSPAVANGYVYVGSNDHNVYAFFAKTGVLRWRFLTGSIVHSSPAVGTSQGL